MIFVLCDEMLACSLCYMHLMSCCSIAVPRQKGQLICRSELSDFHDDVTVSCITVNLLFSVRQLRY